MKKKGKEKEAKKDGPTVNAVNATSHTSSSQELNLGGVAPSKDQWKDWGLG